MKEWISAVDGYREKNKSRVWTSPGRGRTYKRSLCRRSPSRKKLTEKWTKDDTTGLLVIIGIVVFGGLFGKILPVLMVLAMICAIIYLIYKMGNNPDKLVVSEERIAEINRIFEIISESQDLVNKSNNIEIVKTRLDLLLKMMESIGEYEEYELQAAGYTKSTMQEQKDFICDKYDIVINQSIERAYEKEKKDAQKLKTVSGRNRRIQSFFGKVRSIDWLTNSNIQFLNELEEKNNYIK